MRLFYFPATKVRESTLEQCNVGMILTLFACLVACLFQLTCAITKNPAEYQEDLLLTPLPSSALLASFTFRSNTTWSSFGNQPFRHFPRSLGQILEHAKTKELHLRFSSGRWDAESWGARPRGGRNEGGTGVELWAWVEADDPQQYVQTLCKRRTLKLTTPGHLQAGSP